MSSRYDIRRFLDVRSAAAPGFGFEGTHFTFLANITGVHQLWRVPAGGGWPVQLTFSEEPVRVAAASPSTEDVLFTMDKGGDECTQIYRVRPTARTPTGDWEGWEVNQLTDSPGAIHEFGGWASDGEHFAFSSNREECGRFDIFVQHVNEREATRVATGPGGYFFAWGWSPDGRYLIVWEYGSTMQQSLKVLDLCSSEMSNVADRDGKTQYMWPCWAADSRAIYCVSNAGGLDLPSPARIDLATGELEYLDRPVHETEMVQASRDGRWLAWSLNVDGRTLVRLKDLERNRIFEPELPLAVASDLAFSVDGKRLALSVDNALLGREIWTCDLPDRPEGSARLERRTYCARAGIPPAAISEPELITYESFDGLRIPAWFSRPPGVDRPPAVVAIHGGPEGQARPIYLPLTQYLVHRGYAVLAPNYRGSGGYGLAYRQLDDGRRRMDSVTDITYGGQWLREQGGVDPARIAAMGASYGGFAALATAAQQPDLWAAVVSIAGITSFITFLENTGAYRRAEREAEYGTIEENRDFLIGISPVTQIDRIRCPVLLMHGANDPRVPLEGTESFADDLRRRGNEVALIRFEDEGHGLTKLHNQVKAYSAIADFLDRVFGNISRSGQMSRLPVNMVR
jgi:dipeptidyl aminopeptidase/acylaminoacyl peptidase